MVKIFSIKRKGTKEKYKFLGLTVFWRNRYDYIRLNELAYIANLQSANNLHQKVFPKYKNINEGKDVVIIASGPTLKDFIPLEQAIYVGVNSAFRHKGIKFDYLFVQDFAAATPTYIEEFCKYKGAKKFLGFVPEYIMPECVIPDKYGSFPDVERYYVAHPTQKTNFTYDIASQPLGDSYSIIFSAMQFVLWTHPRKIYLVGCDTNTNGYYSTKDKNCLSVDKVKAGWGKMKAFIKSYYPNIEIISINPVGLKSMFKDEYQKKKETL